MRKQHPPTIVPPPANGCGDFKSQPEDFKTSVPGTQAPGETGASPPEWWEPIIAHYGSGKPSRFAEALVTTIPIEEDETRLLDIGCGSGIIGIYCLIARKAKSVTFTDIRPEWIEITSQNVAVKINQGVIKQSQVSIIAKPCSFTDIPAEVLDTCNLMSFNSPQLPTDYVDEKDWRKIASDPTKNAFRIGGRDGLKVVREFLEWYARPNSPKPGAVILLSSFLGRRRIEQALDLHGIRWALCGETPGVPLRPFFLKEKINALSGPEREDRSLKPDGAGWWTKSLLTIRLAYR